ncbi:DNA-directed RNA polymerase [Candidatus Woesearchaeota archaeon]|nr:DNA-directed RNA polymerase [Candidatus Woesearchaeota archaeon]
MGEFNRRPREGGFNRRPREGGFNKPRGGGFRGNFGPREMHKAICSECSQECEVPFKPTEGKPVYCKECFRKKRRF